MRITAGLVTCASFVATAATIFNAFLINKQFYPAMVYLTKSNASMAVIYFQTLVLVYISFQIIRSIFFGELRAAEAEHLSERAWHAILETCLAFTVFRDDFSPLFVLQFVFLLLIKSFHWLADDRVDMMERSPVITIKFHIRIMAIIGLLSGIDSYLVSHAYFTTILKGASSQIVFGFEYAILLTMVLHVTIKYILHMHDHRMRTHQSWDNKAVYLLYAELIINFVRCLLYGAFSIVMLRVHTFPLFSVRPFYLSIRSLHKAFFDVVNSRRAINMMNTQFATATAEELAAMDATCIICREEMASESSPKRLPCGHVFHSHCLRSWFQRQQTCPTCRNDIWGRQAANNAAEGRVRAAAAVGQAPPPQAAGAAAPPPMGVPPPGQANHIPPLPNIFAQHPAFAQRYPNTPPPTQAPPNQQAANGDAATFQQQAGQQGQFPHPIFYAPPPPVHGLPFPFPVTPPPPFSPMAGFMPPPPLPFPPRPAMDGLSDEELRQLEGESRAAVEGRIRLLQNISTLLDAAVMHMQIYLNAMNSPVVSMPAPPSTAPADTSDAPSPNSTAYPQSDSLSTRAVRGSPVPSNTTLSTANNSSSRLEETEDDAQSTPSAPKSLFSAGSTKSFTKLGNSETNTTETTASPSEASISTSTSPTGVERSPSSEEIRRRRLQRFDPSNADSPSTSNA